VAAGAYADAAGNGGSAASDTVAIDRAEAPADVLSPTDIKFALDEVSADGQGSNLNKNAVLGTLTAVDADSASWTFAIGGADMSKFALSPSTGSQPSVQLMVGNSNLTAGTYTITITATDGAGHTMSPETFKIWVGTTSGGGADGSLAAPILISTGSDIDFGLNGSDVISGGSGDDALVGGQAADTLNGGLGNDEVLGGANDDLFRFQIQDGDADLTHYGVDRILDMNANGNDTIQLDDAIFGGLVNAGSALAAGQFNATGVATGSGPQVIYDATTGALSYDADGAGGQASVQFAQVDLGTALTKDDFFIV
jgi:Ca2+-binding RTX toxin-like protein